MKRFVGAFRDRRGVGFAMILAGRKYMRGMDGIGGIEVEAENVKGSVRRIGCHGLEVDNVLL